MLVVGVVCTVWSLIRLYEILNSQFSNTWKNNQGENAKQREDKDTNYVFRWSTFRNIPIFLWGMLDIIASVTQTRTFSSALCNVYELTPNEPAELWKRLPTLCLPYIVFTKLCCSSDGCWQCLCVVIPWAPSRCSVTLPSAWNLSDTAGRGGLSNKSCTKHRTPYIARVDLLNLI